MGEISPEPFGFPASHGARTRYLLCVMASQDEVPTDVEGPMSSKGGKDYIDPNALGARLGKKLSAHFDNGARQGVIQAKVDQRALAKKEVKKSRTR